MCWWGKRKDTTIESEKERKQREKQEDEDEQEIEELVALDII